MATRRHAVGLLVLCAVLWSTGGILIKWLPGPAFAIAGVRSVLASVVLLLALREWPGRWSWWLGSGALAGAASMLGFVVATKLTTAANAIFLVYTAPLYVALLSPWVLHEPIRRGDWLTLLLALLGLGCFCVEQLTLAGWVGNLCALGSGLATAWLVVCLRSPVKVIFLFSVWYTSGLRHRRSVGGHHARQSVRTFCGEKSYFCHGAWHAGTRFGSGPTRRLVCPDRSEAVHTHCVVFDGL